MRQGKQKGVIMKCEYCGSTDGKRSKYRPDTCGHCGAEMKQDEAPKFTVNGKFNQLDAETKKQLLLDTYRVIRMFL